MTLPWKSAGLRFAVLLPACAAVLAYALTCVQVYRASDYADNGDVAGLQRATEIQPGNAAYHCRLGRRLWQEKQDFHAAIAELQAGVALNRDDPYCWLQLAGTAQNAGDEKLRDTAFAEAVAADPKTPAVLWEAANFNCVRGETTEALHQLRLAMQYQDSLLEPGVQLEWRATRDPGLMLREGIPPLPTAHLSLLELLIRQNDAAGAALVWPALLKLGKPFDPVRGYKYITYLLDHDYDEQVRPAWNQLVATLPALRGYEAQPDNLIVNAGFERDVLNGGLDWHYDARAGVSASIDPDESHSGARSLALAFDGAFDDVGVTQRVAVRPNTEYVFSAWFKP